MRRLTLILLTLLLAGGFSAAWPAGARADEGGGDNLAIAINTKDGASLFKFAFSIKKVAGDVVDNTNAAVAYASCTDCRTIAIAIQIVLVTGDPSVVTPENIALAINDQCTLCETMASAYQFVFGGGDVPLRFTHEGRKQLGEIRNAFRDLMKESDQLTLAEVDARVEALVNRLRAVIQNELVPKEQEKQDDEAPDEDQSETPTTTSTLTTTTEPTATTESTTTTTEPATTTTTTTTPETTTTTP
jgi:putative peptide zinc metalloprotease protein